MVVSQHALTGVNVLATTVDALVAQVWSNYSPVITKNHFRSPLDPRCAECGPLDQRHQHHPAPTCWKSPTLWPAQSDSLGLRPRNLCFTSASPGILTCTKTYWSRVERSRCSPYTSTSLRTLLCCLQLDKRVCYWLFSGSVLMAGLTSEDSYMHSPTFSNKSSVKIPTGFFLGWMKSLFSLLNTVLQLSLFL